MQYAVQDDDDDEDEDAPLTERASRLAKRLASGEHSSLSLRIIAHLDSSFMFFFARPRFSPLHTGRRRASEQTNERLSHTRAFVVIGACSP